MSLGIIIKITIYIEFYCKTSYKILFELSTKKYFFGEIKYFRLLFLIYSYLQFYFLLKIIK